MYFLSRMIIIRVVISLLFLLSASLAIRAADFNEDLLKAAQKGDAAKIKSLIEAGANVNAADRKGCTALYKAADKGRTEAVKMLLQAGADRRIRCKNGKTPLFQAKKKKNRESIVELLDVSTAVRNGNTDAVRLNLSLGENANVRNRSGYTLLMLAAENGSLKIVNLLLNAGVHPDTQSMVLTLKDEVLVIDSQGRYRYTILGKGKEPRGPTALALAMINDHTEIVERLLVGRAERGIEYVCKELRLNIGISVELFLAQARQFSSVNINWGGGRTVQARHKNSLGFSEVEVLSHIPPAKEVKCSLIDHARALGRTELVEIILATKVSQLADSHARDGEGLRKAAFTGDVAQVRALLEKGTDIDHQSRHGVTALISASLKGHEEIVQALLARGAEVNHQAHSNGITALISASQLGHEWIVQALLAKGANVELRENDGATALSVARTQQIKQLLRAAGATQ